MLDIVSRYQINIRHSNIFQKRAWLKLIFKNIILGDPLGIKSCWILITDSKCIFHVPERVMAKCSFLNIALGTKFRETKLLDIVKRDQINISFCIMFQIWAWIKLGQYCWLLDTLLKPGTTPQAGLGGPTPSGEGRGAACRARPNLILEKNFVRDLSSSRVDVLN